MTTLEVEVALMRNLDIRKNVIVTNLNGGVVKDMHECDLIVLSPSNYATEIEIKISKYDIANEDDKTHGHSHNHIARLYFAVPEELVEIALEKIPKKAGLIKVITKHNTLKGTHSHHIRVVRKPQRNPNAVMWTDKERNQLTRLGTMRVLGLKEKIIKLLNK